MFLAGCLENSLTTNLMTTYEIQWWDIRMAGHVKEKKDNIQYTDTKREESMYRSDLDKIAAVCPQVCPVSVHKPYL